MTKSMYLTVAWLLTGAGLLMLPQLVFWPGVLLFAAYVAYNLYRQKDNDDE